MIEILTSSIFTFIIIFYIINKKKDKNKLPFAFRKEISKS